MNGINNTPIVLTKKKNDVWAQEIEPKQTFLEKHNSKLIGALIGTVSIPALSVYVAHKRRRSKEAAFWIGLVLQGALTLGPFAYKSRGIERVKIEAVSIKHSLEYISINDKSSESVGGIVLAGVGTFATNLGPYISLYAKPTHPLTKITIDGGKDGENEISCVAKYENHSVPTTLNSPDSLEVTIKKNRFLLPDDTLQLGPIGTNTYRSVCEQVYTKNIAQIK